MTSASSSESNTYWAFPPIACSSAAPLQKKLQRRYRRTEFPQRSFSSFRHRARSWSRQRHICYQAEHTAVGSNLRFLITNVAGRASAVFAFYNDRGACENRIEECKNGFRADRLSGHRFLANAFRLLRHAFAYNLVNLFRLLQLPQAWRSLQIETLRARLFKIGARIRQTARCIRIHLATGWPWRALFSRLALASIPVSRFLRCQSRWSCTSGRSLLQNNIPPSLCSTSSSLRSFNASHDDSKPKKPQIPIAERQNFNSHELSRLAANH